MKFQDSSFNGLKVTVGTKSVTHPPTHAPTHAPKAICPINFFKVGGIIKKQTKQVPTKAATTIIEILSLHPEEADRRAGSVYLQHATII